jgi:NAD-dependent deacetylase
MIIVLINELKEIISGSNNIVFFGGAGTSTESDIPDFRSQDGLYQNKNSYKYPPEVMLSHDFFMNHTEEFYRFYKAKMIYMDARPNPAHKALVKLEKMGKLKAVVTQNIDGLHQMAGSNNVLELHGSIHRNYCMECGESYKLEYIIKKDTIIPICEKCGGIIKPDVVLYGEQLDNRTISKVVGFITNAEVLIIGGTSLAVYPAASLIDYYLGNKLVLLNKSVTQSDRKAKLVIRDNIGEVLEKAINQL